METILKSFAALISAIVLVGCSSAPPPVPAEFETPSAEAVLRQLLKDCPHTSEAQVFCIVLGEQLSPCTPEFMARFEDTGHNFVDAKEMKVEFINAMPVIVEKESRATPLTLQIGKVESMVGGLDNIEAAWAFDREMVRKSFEVKTEEDGKTVISVTEKEVIETKTGEDPPADE